MGNQVVIDAGTSREETVRKDHVLGDTSPQGELEPWHFAMDHDDGFGVTVPFTGSRQPGKININTIWDKEVFRALCDAQPSNRFYGPNLNSTYPPDKLVDDIFRAMAQADPWLQESPTGPPYVRPFTGFGTGFDARSYQWPDGIGINNTLLSTSKPGNPDPGLPRLFEVPNQDHPYRKFELLTKIANNVTVRSNVFAVWCTAGFFQVDEDGRLGPEIGRAVGRHKRHRFFAIVDRSVLDTWVRMMDAEVVFMLYGPYVYDVRFGTAPQPGLGGPVMGSQWDFVIPLLGNARFDPRRDYAVVPAGIPILLREEGVGEGHHVSRDYVVRAPSGPPATVLYSVVIE
jgi:hypothetical protein